MRGYNRVVIAGNLTRDPLLSYTVNQRAFLRFTVAVGYRYKSQQTGEYQESADYISVVAWGATGESIAKFLKKGTPVLVEGRLRTGSYEKDGIKRYTTDVMADNIILLGFGQNSNGSDYNSQQINRNNNNLGMIDPANYVSPMPGGDFSNINERPFNDDFNQGFPGNFDDNPDNSDNPIPF